MIVTKVASEALSDSQIGRPRIPDPTKKLFWTTVMLVTTLYLSSTQTVSYIRHQHGLNLFMLGRLTFVFAVDHSKFKLVSNSSIIKVR